MKEKRYLRVQPRSDICAGNASTRLRRREIFLAIARRYSALALREIIARGRARSRAVFDCGKLAAAARKAPAEEHRRTSCIMCKSWPPVPIIISLLFLLGSFYFAPWTWDSRFACELCGEARGIKNARTSSPQLISVIYARKSLEAIRTISCHAHRAFSDFLTIWCFSSR